MSLRSEIDAKFTLAMKNKDAAATSAYRMLRASLKNYEIEKRVKELTDEQVIEVVGREVKKIKDSLVDFEKAGRDDLSSAAKKEIELLSAFLPAQMSEGELPAVVKAKAESLGLSGEAAFGRLMGEVMKEVKGKADGGAVSRAVKEYLKGQT